MTSIACAPMTMLQPTIDAARRVAHTIGARPYRVFLVWQERDRMRVWHEVHRIELMPVRVIAMDAVDVRMAAVGLKPEGAISLREVSPAQVTTDTLRGFLDGVDWAAEAGDREFFYEVTMHERCAGAGSTAPRRFTLGADPHLEGASSEFRVQLVDQSIARDSAGLDRSIGDQPVLGPRIVT